MKKTSLNDIAKQLGVSKTLVSLVLNGKGREHRISEEICKKEQNEAPVPQHVAQRGSPTTHLRRGAKAVWKQEERYDSIGHRRDAITDEQPLVTYLSQKAARSHSAGKAEIDRPANHSVCRHPTVRRNDISQQGTGRRVIHPVGQA